jgi:Secretion system C-terminal sorting domain
MRLDPTTGAILESIAGPAAVGGIRFATWDPTEGGGFWVGNLSSDLYKVSRTGTIIRIIPRGTHGLVAMGGAAYDDVSVGGPYLWVNCQSDFVGTGYGSTIVRQIQLSNGVGTSVLRDAKINIPAITNSNLGGGITIATLPGFTKPSLIVAVQNTPTYSGAIIGYELNFVKPNDVDMGLDSLDLVNGFSVMPLRHRNPAVLRVKARNIGFSQEATTASVLTEIYRNQNLEFTQTNSTTVPAISLLSFTTASAFVPPATGNYVGFSYATATGDPNRLNDTATVNFAISDSTYATDNCELPNAFVTALSIGGTVAMPGQKRLGMTYRLPIASTINSVTILFRPQFADDSVQIKIYRIVNGIPSDSIGSSPIYVTTTGDAGTALTLRTLQLSKPLTVAANQEFVICLTEGRGSMRLASTLKGYRPQTMWAYGTNWINTDTFSNATFRAALFLRPNISVKVGTNNVNSNINAVKIFPNPTTDALSVSVQLQDVDNTTIELYDVAGRRVLQDKTIGNQSFTKNLSLQNLPSGVYILKVATAKGTWQEKVFKE